MEKELDLGKFIRVVPFGIGGVNDKGKPKDFAIYEEAQFSLYENVFKNTKDSADIKQISSTQYTDAEIKTLLLDLYNRYPGKIHPEVIADSHQNSLNNVKTGEFYVFNQGKGHWFVKQRGNGAASDQVWNSSGSGSNCIQQKGLDCGLCTLLNLENLASGESIHTQKSYDENWQDYRLYHAYIVMKEIEQESHNEIDKATFLQRAFWQEKGVEFSLKPCGVECGNSKIEIKDLTKSIFNSVQYVNNDKENQEKITSKFYETYKVVSENLFSINPKMFLKSHYDIIQTKDSGYEVNYKNIASYIKRQENEIRSKIKAIEDDFAQYGIKIDPNQPSDPKNPQDFKKMYIEGKFTKLNPRIKLEHLPDYKKKELSDQFESAMIRLNLNKNNLEKVKEINKFSEDTITKAIGEDNDVSDEITKVIANLNSIDASSSSNAEEISNGVRHIVDIFNRNMNLIINSCKKNQVTDPNKGDKNEIPKDNKSTLTPEQGEQSQKKKDFLRIILLIGKHYGLEKMPDGICVRDGEYIDVKWDNSFKLDDYLKKDIGEFNKLELDTFNKLTWSKFGLLTQDCGFMGLEKISKDIENLIDNSNTKLNDEFVKKLVPKEEFMKSYEGDKKKEEERKKSGFAYHVKNDIEVENKNMIRISPTEFGILKNDENFDKSARRIDLTKAQEDARYKKDDVLPKIGRKEEFLDEPNTENQIAKIAKIISQTSYNHLGGLDPIKIKALMEFAVENGGLSNVINENPQKLDELVNKTKNDFSLMSSNVFQVTDKEDFKKKITKFSIECQNEFKKQGIMTGRVNLDDITYAQCHTMLDEELKRGKDKVKLQGKIQALESVKDNPKELKKFIKENIKIDDKVGMRLNKMTAKEIDEVIRYMQENEFELIKFLGPPKIVDDVVGRNS